MPPLLTQLATVAPRLIHHPALEAQQQHHLQLQAQQLLLQPLETP